MTEFYRVERSPVRQFLVGLTGILLLLVAFDLLGGHWVSTPPEAGSDGALTTRGAARQRDYRLWGTAVLVVGVAAFGGGVVGLVRRRPPVALRDEGVALDLGPGGPVVVPWERIRAVRRCRSEEEPMRDLLCIEVDDRRGFPELPWGATWRGRVLAIEADGWTDPVPELVVRIDLALRTMRRRPVPDEEEP